MTLLRRWRSATVAAQQLGGAASRWPCAYCCDSAIGATRSFASNPESEDAQDSEKGSWFAKLLRGDPTQTSSSKAIGQPNVLYRLNFVQLKTKYRDEFIDLGAKVLPQFTDSSRTCHLVAGWRTMIGDTDEIVHLWKYKDGYKSMDDQGLSVLPTNEVFQNFLKDTKHMIHSQSSEICMQFGYWDSPRERDEKHVYDLRTYRLKPGSMIEWANHWATGIEARKSHNQDVAGLFTHIGELYTVHHIWAYKSFQERKKIRDSAWENPSWAATVSNTVPLIRSVNTRIMSALPYSSLK